MIKFTWKFFVLFILLLFGLSFLSVAYAKDLDDVATTITDQTQGILELIQMVAYLVGTGFGVKGALKLKEHNETKGQVPLSAPIFLFVVAGLLIALPSVLDVAMGSTLNVGGNQQGYLTVETAKNKK